MEALLLKAIARDPADNLTRFAYADWQEEHGDVRIAQFVRMQLALAALPPRPSAPLERAAWIVNVAPKLQKLQEEHRKLMGDKWVAVYNAHEPSLEPPWLPKPDFRWFGTYAFGRGFVHGVTASLDEFMRVAPRLAQLPVQVVNLTWTRTTVRFYRGAYRLHNVHKELKEFLADEYADSNTARLALSVACVKYFRKLNE